jgi:ferredoxin
MHKKVTIDESCIACGACVEICPDVFDLEDEGDIAFVKEEANFYLDEEIMEAADACPAVAIHYEK